MFAKLLKHEFRATRNFMMILCLTALGAGLLDGCVIGYLFRFEGTVSTLMGVLCVVFLIFSLLFIAMCGVGSLILMIVRFYKSRFTDEGYLTFTLPVTTHQVLLSSVISSGLNILLAGVTVFLSFILMAVVGCSFMEGFWQIVGEMLPDIWQGIRETMTWEIAGNMGLMLLNAITGGICQLVLIMVSVTIGALTAKKHKILAAIGVYYGISIIMGFASAMLMGSIIANGLFASGALFLGLSALMFSLVAVAGYFLMYFLMSRKLNLP